MTVSVASASAWMTSQVSAGKRKAASSRQQSDDPSVQAEQAAWLASKSAAKRSRKK